MSKSVEEYKELINAYNNLQDKNGKEADDIMEDLDYVWSQLTEEEQKEFRINIVPTPVKAPQEKNLDLILQLSLAQLMGQSGYNLAHPLGNGMGGIAGNTPKQTYTEEYVNAKVAQAYKAGFQDGLVEGSNSYRDYYKDDENQFNDDD